MYGNAEKGEKREQRNDTDRRIRNYKQIATRLVPEELHALLPTSFDIIGDIAVVKIDDGILQYKNDIGEAILQAYKSIKTVAHDSGVEGEVRRRSVEIIAGENRTTTVHKEYGVSLTVDIANAYFSPRLATERWRVAQQVSGNETIVDAFAGVGPFSVIIAKHKKPAKVYAIDINPSAYSCLENNIRKNKVAGIVTGILGDVGDVLPEIAGREKINRIIMNLPWKSFDYLGTAMRAVADGGIIHFYEIYDKDGIDARIESFKGIADANGCSVTVQQRRTIKSYSPAQVNYVADLKVAK